MATSPVLDQLRDIHPPHAVAWWPLAPGWWLLMAALLLLAGGAWWYAKQRRARWQRAALRQMRQEIAQITRRYHELHDGNAACAALSALMRRVALRCFPEDRIAGLHGEQWLRYLDDKELIGERFAHSPLGAMLLHAPYSTDEVDPEPLIDLGRRWMEAALQHPALPKREAER